MGGQRLPYMDSPPAGPAGCSRPCARATLIFAPPRGRISHCVAEHVRLELRNVAANYPFERAQDLRGSSRILATETIRVRAATFRTVPIARYKAKLKAVTKEEGLKDGGIGRGGRQYFLGDGGDRFIDDPAQA